MRIAVVTTSWPAFTGDPSGHFVHAEARELEEAGHTVAVVAPRAGHDGAFGWPGVAARLRERPWRAFDAARWILSARRRVSDLQADRIVAHWAVPCAWPVAVGVAHGELEIVSHGGDVRLLLAMPRMLRARVARAMAGRAMRWRFVSDALLGALLSALSPEARRAVHRIAMVRAPSVLMPDVRDAVAQRARELGGLRVAVSVGRLVASKRVDRAIEHMARAREADVLVIVGDGPERRRLEALARAHRVDARFVGAVPREDALAWIGAATVVLHASETEGLSTVVREAEALGTPVVQVCEGMCLALGERVPIEASPWIGSMTPFTACVGGHAPRRNLDHVPGTKGWQVEPKGRRI